VPESTADLHTAVLEWYAEHGRALAFRGTTDPWAILVSEVMAQQTQAARAAEAWTGFISTYPTPASLAGVPPAAVLRAWRGLGYNRRALALREAAARIVEQHDGEVPADIEALMGLPGVGPYTARAVAALAFGVAVGPVDTNVRRVLTRAFFDAPPGPRDVQALADALAPAHDPGTWTHAVMDLGAQVCQPREPRCEACPLAPDCRHAANRRAMPDVDVSPAGRRKAAPFASTARWLRGRIIDRLRDAPDGDWVRFDEPIGVHDTPAVATELARLSGDGLLEQHPDDATAARLIAS